MIYLNARAIIENFGNGDRMVLVQWRTKEGQEYYEFPGGQVNKNESFLAAVAREIKEETGLELTKIEGAESRVDTSGMSYVFDAECVKPYAVYQTLRGPVVSVGVYFRCEAYGEILETGDDTKLIQWVSLSKLEELLEGVKLFSDIDRAAAILYLKEVTG